MQLLKIHSLWNSYHSADIYLVSGNEETVNRNSSAIRKLWWDQKLEIKIDFVFLEDFVLYTLFTKKSRQEDLISLTINGANRKEEEREGSPQRVSEVFIITAYIC